MQEAQGLISSTKKMGRREERKEVGEEGAGREEEIKDRGRQRQKLLLCKGQDYKNKIG